MAVSQNAPVQGRISRIYDHLYANAPVKTPAAIAYEFGKLAHACLYIEQNNEKWSVQRARGPGKQSSKQSDDAGTAARMRGAFLRMADEWDMYDDDRSINLADFDIEYCISQLGDLRFADPNHDLLGDIFEIIRSQFAKEKGGQFFTDPQVTHLAIKLLDFNPFAGDDLVDICSGTGGFLLAGMAHLEERADVEGSTLLSDLVSQAFIGVEIDRDAAEAANSTIRARFGNEVTNLVRVGDSLRIQSEDAASRIAFGTHRCAATNPPFGTKITIKDPAILAQFELAGLSPRDGLTKNRSYPQAPDTLFLEQNLRLLIPESGRLAIVVPYQLLSGPQALPLREWLIRHARVKAVIDLPADTFQPHTGTKGALVLLSRRNQPLDDLQLAATEDVFMSAPQHVGHDRRGNAVYKKSEDGFASTEILTDFGEVAKAFELHKGGHAPELAHSRSFSVSMGEVLSTELKNLNAGFYLGREAAKTHLERGSGEFVRLGDLVETVFFPSRFKRNYVSADTPGAVPFMGGAGITEFITTGRKWLSPSDPNLQKLQVRAGWILVTRSGTTGIVSTVPEVWDGIAVSEHVIRVVPNPAKLPAGYLYAVLASQQGQNYLRRGIFGSVIDEITPEYIANMRLLLPADRSLLESISSAMQSAEIDRSRAMKTFTKVTATIDEMWVS